MKWKEVVGLEDYYMVSDTGKVFSIRSNRLLTTNVPDKDGYIRIDLTIDGKTYKKAVHRLVAEAFIPNPDNLPCVNHKDEIPWHNEVENLEWCTYKYNSNYGACIERRVENTAYKTGADNHNSRTVYQFDMQGNLVDTFASAGEASRKTGLDAKTIAKAARGELKKYANYVWKYTDEFHYDDHKHYENRNGTVYMYDPSGNLIKEYNSPDEMRADGLNPANVNRVCRGERKTYNNFIFTRKADT